GAGRRPAPRARRSPPAQARPRAIEESEGVIVRAGLVAGEPIADDKLIRLKKPTVMAAFLRQGYRAISINISPATTAGGFVLPGDYVDVIMTSKVRTEEPSEAGAPESRPRRTRVLISRTLLTSVRVLGIDERFAPGNAANSGKVRTATLEVTPEQAEIVALAEQGGDLRLALRSVAELIPEHGQRPIDPVPVLAFDPREGAEDGEEVAPAHLVKTLRFNTPGSMALE
ncbi:MAG: Flp pilus assembly protein CpaB, partial [Pseudomonadota bacterium]